MLVVASGLAAVIPMLFYLFPIWIFDRYDREPLDMVLKNYLWGAIGAIIFAIIGSLILSGIFSPFITDEFLADRFETVVVAPFVEELTKGLFLLITFRSKKFDNLTDGIVYGGAIGLGFGMTENFLYFITYGTTVADWIIIVIIRTLFSAVMHCVSTATFGAFLGYSKYRGKKFRYILPTIGMAIAMFIHFAWNFSVSMESLAPLGFLFMGVTIVIFIVVFAVSVAGEKKIIYYELVEEAQSGLIPVEHLFIISSPQRNSKGWVDESIRKSYIKAATRLAFRKMQLKYAKGINAEFYENDIENHRLFIRNLLSSINPV